MPSGKATEKFAGVGNSLSLKLARQIASQFVALKRFGMAAALQAVAGVTSTGDNYLSAFREETGFQPRVLQLPPLIPTFASRCLLQLNLGQKLAAAVQVPMQHGITDLSLVQDVKLLDDLAPLLPSTLQEGCDNFWATNRTKKRSRSLTRFWRPFLRRMLRFLKRIITCLRHSMDGTTIH